MSTMLTLLGKEFKAQWRTYRLLIVAAVFFIFGLGTPLLLKYLHALVPADAITGALPQFTAADSARGYVDTFGQIGLLAAILVAMGSVAAERESGTAAMILAKPVGAGQFITSKLVAVAVTFGLGVAIGAIGCYFYTLVLFGSPGGFNFLVANLIGWLYLVWCLSVTVMYSCFFRSQLAAGGLALVTLAAVAGTAGLPVVKDYSPGALSALSRAWASGDETIVWGALAVTLALIPLTMYVGWQVLKRKEL